MDEASPKHDEPFDSSEPVLGSSKSDNAKIFPQKLMEILSEPSNSDSIVWLPNGKVFMIVDRNKFAQKVLPHYFGKTKYASFTRKLNRWNFTRMTRGREPAAYSHEFFQRDNEALCTQMYCNNDRAKFATLSRESELNISDGVKTSSLLHKRALIERSIQEHTSLPSQSGTHSSVVNRFPDDFFPALWNPLTISLKDPDFQSSALSFNQKAGVEQAQLTPTYTEFKTQKNELIQALADREVDMERNNLSQHMLTNSLLGYRPHHDHVTAQVPPQHASLLTLQKLAALQHEHSNPRASFS